MRRIERRNARPGRTVANVPEVGMAFGRRASLAHAAAMDRILAILFPITAFVAMCVVAVLAYAAVVRWIDPLARPLLRTRGAAGQPPSVVNTS